MDEQCQDLNLVRSLRYSLIGCCKRAVGAKSANTLDRNGWLRAELASILLKIYTDIPHYRLGVH